MEPLHDLDVLITGAASGLGRRLAHELFWRERCRLILVDRDAARLEIVKNELSPDAPRVEAFACDVSSADSVAALMKALGDRPVDVLVNNAGVFHVGLFENTEIGDFERVVGVNLMGAVRMTNAFLPRLLESPRAFVVNISSMAGLLGAPGMCAYAASKAGLVGFSRALAGELRGRVGVCVVCPTFIRTSIAENAIGRTGKAGTMNVLLKALGSDPRRAARAVVRAIRDRRRFVLVNPDARALYWLDRICPPAARFVVEKAYGRVRATGIFE